MLDPGRIVASYEVQERVGVGGMAEVYRVTHRLLGSTHALKVLRPELAADPELRARFLAEGRVQAQIRHPHIAPVTDVVAEEGVAGLVMEYLAGGTLEARLAQRGVPLSAAEVWEVLRPALDAVEALHARGIVHRDLKTANLLFRDARWSSVVLADFGIAHVDDDAQVTGARTHRTRTGLLLGTPSYMSPEQVRGQPVDARADVFALGVIAWELLTLKTPFDRDNDFDTMQAIVGGQRPHLREAAPEVPTPIVSVIERALSVVAAERHGSAGAFAWAWEEALRAPPPPRTTTLPDPTPGLPSHLLDVSPAEVRPADVQPEVADAPALPAAPAPARRWGCGTWLLILLLLATLAGAAAMGFVWWVAEQQAASRALAQDVLVGLRDNKTRPDLNTDEHLAQVVDRATLAVERWPTAEALSARFLAVTWQQGWHRQGAAWDPDRFAAAERAYAEARDAGLRMPGQVGAAFLAMAGCRFHADDGERGRWCGRLPDLVSRATDGARAIGEEWLVVEVAWAGVQAARDEAQRSKDPAWLRTGEAMCQSAVDLIASAPVNGRFLLQNCVILAGHTQSWDAYLDRAARLLAQADNGGKERSKDALYVIYTGAGAACADKKTLELGKDNRPKSWANAGEGGWGDLCVYLGRHAEGCDALAEDQRPAECTRPVRYDLWGYPIDLSQWVPPTCTPIRGKNVPWAAAEAAVANLRGPRPACLIKR